MLDEIGTRPPPVVGADGFPRRRFTIREIEAMQAAEIIGPEEKFELVEGEIIPMQSKLNAHERVKLYLIEALVPRLPSHFRLGVETSLFMSEDTVLDPDLSVIPRDSATDEVDPADVPLIIEIASTTQRYDLRRKAPLYARHGVREYWVIDTSADVVIVHLGPSDDGWKSVTRYAGDETVTTTALPGFAFRLADVP